MISDKCDYRAKDTKWSELAKPYYAEALENYEKYIATPSYNDPKTATKEHPFGQYVENALAFTAELGKRLGFKVDRCDNYCTELSYGEGPLIDVYAHSDTVPVVLKNWNTDPFKPTIVGDRIIGRGASDDKGPGLACLYGVKALKDHGLIDGYRVRFVFGGNEELDERCLEHYFHVLKKGYPTYGISPDADFPLIYAEKALCNYDATYNVDLGPAPFRWGTVLNLVCEDAEYDFKNLPAHLPFDKVKAVVDNYLADHPEIKGTWNGTLLHVKGKGYHGSMPWNGVNAGLYMINILGKVIGLQRLHEVYEDYKTGDGQPFGGNYKSKAFDRSSYCVGMFSYTSGKLVLHVNMRLPEDADIDEAAQNVRERTYVDKLKVTSKTPALYVDPKSAFIKTLMGVYQEETGDTKSKPEAIGGGTYAKESQNTVGFGGCFPGRDFGMHEDNEWFYIPDFYADIGIFAHAVYALGQLAKKEAKK